MYHFPLRGIVILASVLLSGCAASLHPLYESKDDLLDPTPLKGVWKNERWMCRVETRNDEPKGSTFIVSLLEIPVAPHADGKSPIPPDAVAVLVGGLVKIGDQQYLDLAATPGLLQIPGVELAPSAVFLLMPAHVFFKVQHKKDRIVLIPLDREKLDKLLVRDPKAVAHTRIKSQELAELNGEYPLPSPVLTAEPKQLREFLRKYGDADIWMDVKDATVLEFRRGEKEEFEKRFQHVAERLAAAKEDRTTRQRSHRAGRGATRNRTIRKNREEKGSGVVSGNDPRPFFFSDGDSTKSFVQQGPHQRWTGKDSAGFAIAGNRREAPGRVLTFR